MSCLRCGCRGHTESRCTAPSTAQEEQEEQEEIVDSDFPSLPISEVQANIAPVAEANIAPVAEVISAPTDEATNTQVEEREVLETTVRDLKSRVAALEEEIAAIRGFFGGLSASKR